MLAYQYQWVIYKPDLFCGEFVIVGFVLWCSEEARLQHYLTPSIQRATHFFAKGPTHANQTLSTGLKNLDLMLHDLQGQSLPCSQNLASLMQGILPSNENALQMSEVKSASA